jgi:hypothetical protein
MLVLQSSFQLFKDVSNRQGGATSKKRDNGQRARSSISFLIPADHLRPSMGCANNTRKGEEGRTLLEFIRMVNDEMMDKTTQPAKSFPILSLFKFAHLSERRCKLEFYSPSF